MAARKQARKEEPRRAYTKIRRAAAEEDTRRRIVEALIDLHADVGPARTTVSAVAQRAGVERLTVYRHFPDEQEMFRACSSLYLDRNPPPQPAEIEHLEPLVAVRRTLLVVYAWYRKNEAMFTNVLRDVETMPSLQESTAGLHQYVDEVTAALDRLFAQRSAPRRATIHHAVEFLTWRSLSRLTTSDRSAAELATSWISAER